MRLLIDGYNSYVTEEGYLFAVPRASSVYVPVITGTYRPRSRPPMGRGGLQAGADATVDDKIAELNGKNTLFTDGAEER